MKKLIILTLFISTIAFGQNNNQIDISDSENILIGKWKFIKTVDQYGMEVQKISLDRKLPNGDSMNLIAKGPDIVINANGTYTKIFTPENSDNGKWTIKSNNEIEYEMIIPEDSRQGRMIIQTHNFFPDKIWKKDGNGNFLDTSTDMILDLTENEMKVQFEKKYILIYKKTTD